MKSWMGNNPYLFVFCFLVFLLCVGRYERVSIAMVKWAMSNPYLAALCFVVLCCAVSNIGFVKIVHKHYHVREKDIIDEIDKK